MNVRAWIKPPPHTEQGVEDLLPLSGNLGRQLGNLLQVHANSGLKNS